MKLDRSFASILILFALLGLSLLLSIQVGGLSARTRAEGVDLSADAAQDKTGLTSEDATDAALSSVQDVRSTEIPLPTLLPTPAVTRIPAASYPLTPPGVENSAWGIVYRSGNDLRLLDYPSRQEGPLVSSSSLNGLYLAPFSLGAQSWGDIAPDGTRIALVLGPSPELPENRKGTVGEFFDLYLFETVSGDLKLVVEGATDPKWSPDGDWIAYRGADFALWVLDAISGETRQLYRPDAEQGHFVGDFDWSPDGKALAFLDQVLRDTVEIRTVSLDGSTHILVPWQGFQMTSPRWSPDGSWLAFISFEGSPEREQAVQSIWIVDAESGERHQLTEYINVFRLAWGWEGNRLYFDGSARFESSGTGYEIWSLALEDGVVYRLTDNAAVAADETLIGLSPDFRTLLFERDSASAWALSLDNGSLIEMGPIQGLAPIRFP